MPDDDDFAVALSGEKDLVGFVLDQADFRSKTILEADFSGSKLSKSDFSNAILVGCNFREAETPNTKFIQADLKRTSFSGACYNMNFRGADLRNSVMSRCLFTQCDFSQANLIGADFRHARFSDDCIFDGTISDWSTDFENAQVLRPYSKLAPFRFFEFKRGTLNRRSDTTEEPLSAEVLSARTSIRSVLLKLDAIEEGGGFSDETSLIGHNNPPTEFQLSKSTADQARSALLQAQSELEEKGSDASRETLEHAIIVSKEIINQVGRYIGRQADMLISEFSKTFGATMGSKTALVSISLLLSGELTSLVSVLRAILGQ